MNVQETTKLLAVVVAYDGRQVGESTVAAWYDALHDLEYADCEAAARAHYRETDKWLMPAQVRQRARAVRRDRIERGGSPLPQADPDDPAAYRAEVKDRVRQIADGMDLDRALPAGEPSPPTPAYIEARGDERDELRVRSLTVICPHCKAWKGHRCVGPDGEPLRMSPAHPARIDAVTPKPPTDDSDWLALGASNASSTPDPSDSPREGRSGAPGASSRLSGGEWQTPQPSESGR